MDRKYIEEYEIEIKYLRNQLTSEQAEEFEVFLMENPAMLEQLELNKVLFEAAPIIEDSKLNRAGLFSKIIQGFIKAPYQVVAGLSVGAISSFVIMSMGMFNPAYLELNQVGTLSQLRNGEEPWKGRTILEFQAEKFGRFNNETFILSVPANIQLGQFYTATIFSEESGLEEMSIDVNELQSDQYGTLFFVLKAHSFPPGVYRLEVYPKSAKTKDSYVETFVFETKVKGT